jgi:hypothetical protein
MVDQSNYDVFPYDSNDVGTITPYTPTNAEKRVDGLASLIRKIPGQDSNYWSRHTAQNFLKLIDPKQQGGIGEYLPGFSMDLARERNDPLGEALGLLDAIPGGGAGIKMAVVPAVAKYNDKIRKLKFDYNREMYNADHGDGHWAINAANKIRKQIQNLINKRNKAINNITDPGERKAAELSTQDLFHGSSKTGIETLELPSSSYHVTANTVPDVTRTIERSNAQNDFLKKLGIPVAARLVDPVVTLQKGQSYGSPGGLYTVANPSDPRFKAFSKGGSGYRIKSDFNRTLNVDDMPSDVRGSLDELSDFLRSLDSGVLSKNPALGPTLSGKRSIYQLDTMLRRGAGSVNKTPSGFSRDIGNRLKSLDYDSVVFPPRKMKGEGETILSLDPNNLDILQEIPFDQLDDFIRAYLNPK